MADPPKPGGGKKLFGLPRTWAIIIIGSTIAVLAYYWWRSKQNATTAQAGLPSSTSDLSGTPADTSTAAPALGGTPDSGAAQASTSGPDLASLFAAQEGALTNAFESQQSLVGQLAGGYEQLAMSAEAQLGSLAAAGVTQRFPAGAGGGAAPAGGSSTSSPELPSGTVGVAPTPQGFAAAYNPSSGVTYTPEGVTIAPTVQYSSGTDKKQITGPSILAFK